MATSKTTSASSTSKKMTAAELQKWYDTNFAKVQALERFEEASDAIKQIRDVKKSAAKTISTFDKEKLRTYLKNITSQEKNLRDLSWYLYYRSHTYMRIVNFYANMFCLDCRMINPKFDLIKGIDANKSMKSFNETINWIDLMNNQGEFYAPLISAFVQDVFYGIHITDETGTFVFEIPADSARITGKYMTGDFAFEMDATYLKKHPELIEYIPEPFEQIYKDYKSTNEKWQYVGDEYSLCIKFRREDPEIVVPVFTALFNGLINLIDLEDIQAVAQEQEIYKLLWYELETINGSKDIDDWKIDPSLAAKYFDKMLDNALPPYISAAMVPGQLHEISFNNDNASDTTKVAKATETVLNTAGGAEVLNGGTINNTYAFKMASIANTEFAISSLLPQIEGFTNRKLSYLCSNPSHVHYFPISVYTKADFIESMLKAGQNGFAIRLALGTLFGISESAMLSMLHFENEVLGLQNLMIPLSTSYTQSGDNGYTSEIGQGAPEKDAGDLSDSGERSRNQ